jgi:mRNA m6A methyltransferase non-catalytic subunit
MYLRCDILANDFTLASLESEFDVILVEPPLEEYKRTNGIHFDRYVTWEEVKMCMMSTDTYYYFSILSR